jgi:hypothetical protein
MSRISFLVPKTSLVFSPLSAPFITTSGTISAFLVTRDISSIAQPQTDVTIDTMNFRYTWFYEGSFDQLFYVASVDYLTMEETHKEIETGFTIENV